MWTVIAKQFFSLSHDKIKPTNYGWNNLIFSIDSGILTKPFLKSCITRLFNILTPGSFYNVLLTVEYKNNQYRNLGKTNKVSTLDKSDLLEALFAYYDHKTDLYHEMVAVNLIVRVKIIQDKELIGSSSIVHKPAVVTAPSITTFSKIEGYDLPNSTQVFYRLILGNSYSCNRQLNNSRVF